MNASQQPTTGSAATSRAPHGAEPKDEGARHDRLLPLIAAERSIRAVVLVAIGLVLITHPHANWGQKISDLARDLGLDPSRNGIERIIAKVRAISPHKYVVFGGVAIAYDILEGAEGYGLWHRRRWGEYLTVVATSLLFIPEVWELTKSATAVKVVALAVNVAVVVYLVVRLRRYGG